MKKKWIYLLAALTLTVGVCAAKPIIGGAATSIDLDQKCSLIVYGEDKNKAEDMAFGEDLKRAQVVIDVYKVADAVKTPGYDTYSYDMKAPYSSLSIKEGAELTATEWKDLAQKAGRLALGETGDTPLNGEGIETGEAGAAFKDLDCGLYLVVARGKDLVEKSDYMIELEPETEGDPTLLATIANSSRYQYTFTPQLISVPMKGNAESINENGNLYVDENGEYMTSDVGRWVYNLEIYMKPQQLPRFGDLRIIKTLESHEVLDAPNITPPADQEGGEDTRIPEGEHFEALADPATFVFEITVTRTDASGNEEDLTKYNRVESITFTATGEESVLIKGIPADATVRVEEVYSGSSYENTISPDGPVTIVAEDVVEAHFSNRYDWHRRNGYGIKNQFSYQTGEGGNPGWELVQNPEQSVEEEAEEPEP